MGNHNFSTYSSSLHISRCMPYHNQNHNSSWVTLTHDFLYRIRYVITHRIPNYNKLFPLPSQVRYHRMSQSFSVHLHRTSQLLRAQYITMEYLRCNQIFDCIGYCISLSPVVESSSLIIETLRCVIQQSSSTVDLSLTLCVSLIKIAPNHYLGSSMVSKVHYDPLYYSSPLRICLDSACTHMLYKILWFIHNSSFDTQITHLYRQTFT